MLSLFHGDVYCGEGLIRFGMANNDRCIKCFVKKTIMHLLNECEYSKMEWRKLGITNMTVPNMLGLALKRGEL
jgi:hypothetical protein